MKNYEISSISQKWQNLWFDEVFHELDEQTFMNSRIFAGKHVSEVFQKILQVVHPSARRASDATIRFSLAMLADKTSRPLQQTQSFSKAGSGRTAAAGALLRLGWVSVHLC